MYNFYFIQAHIQQKCHSNINNTMESTSSKTSYSFGSMSDVLPIHNASINFKEENVTLPSSCTLRNCQECTLDINNDMGLSLSKAVNSHASICDTSYNTIIISEENNTIPSSANAQPILYTVSNEEMSNTCNDIHTIDVPSLTSCYNTHTHNASINSKKYCTSTMQSEISNSLEPLNTFEPSNSSELSKTFSHHKHDINTQNVSALFSWTG